MQFEHIFKVGGVVYFCYKSEDKIHCADNVYPICSDYVYCGNLVITHKYILNLINGGITPVEYDIISVDQIRFNAVCVRDTKLVIYNQYGRAKNFAVDKLPATLKGSKMELSHCSSKHGISIIVLDMQIALYGTSTLSVCDYNVFVASSPNADEFRNLKTTRLSIKSIAESRPQLPVDLIPKIVCWETVAQVFCKDGDFRVSDELYNIASMYADAEVTELMPISISGVEYNLYIRKYEYRGNMYNTYSVVRNDTITNLLSVSGDENNHVIYARDALYITNIQPTRRRKLELVAKLRFSIDVDKQLSTVCEICKI